MVPLRAPSMIAFTVLSTKFSFTAISMLLSAAAQRVRHRHLVHLGLEERPFHVIELVRLNIGNDELHRIGLPISDMSLVLGRGKHLETGIRFHSVLTDVQAA